MSKATALVGVLFAAAFISPSAHAEETAPPVTSAQVLKATHSWDGKPIAYPAGQGEVTALAIEIQPGAETGWHLHPVPSFAVVSQGTVQVTLRHGRSRQFSAGEAFAEVVNTEHNGRNVGTVPVKLLVFYTGASGAVLTVKE
jgi:quercetin dioxygenase-like cupin family protein